MSERPSTHEMANRHTHGCLLALARVTVSPPMALHGHALPPRTGNDAQLQVDHNRLSWIKENKNKQKNAVKSIQKQQLFDPLSALTVFFYHYSNS